MTMWNPQISPKGPRYLAIADAIARDVTGGDLASGSQLPTHRDLARVLGVTVGTVTRGYTEAERRGLTVGEVGRGTFVRPVPGHEPFGWPENAERPSHPDVIDLSLSVPWISGDGEDGRCFARTLESIAADPGIEDLLGFQPTTALHRHRAAAARWIGRLGLDVTPSRMVLTNGGQHAIGVLLSAMLRPGDLLACAELTYPGLRSAARTFGLRLRGVPLDEEGITPDGLEAACAEGQVRGLYCIPTLHNPTSATMSAERRAAIAEVARKWDLTVIEDEIHIAHGRDPILPLACFAPERTLLIATLSKWAAFGLRIGFVASPEGWVERVRAAVRASSWMPAPLMAEIATRWIEDGTAEHLGQRKLAELDARHELARELLAGFDVRTRPGSLSLWIQLPNTLRADECVSNLQQRGVLVAGPEAFAVGRQVPHAIRVSLAFVKTREELRKGLGILREVLASPSSPCTQVL